MKPNYDQLLPQLEGNGVRVSLHRPKTMERLAVFQIEKDGVRQIGFTTSQVVISMIPIAQALTFARPLVGDHLRVRVEEGRTGSYKTWWLDGILKIEEAHPRGSLEWISEYHIVLVDPAKLVVE